MAPSRTATDATLAQYKGIVASLGGIVWECDLADPSAHHRSRDAADEGGQLADALKGIHPETRVLLMSGYTDHTMPVLPASGVDFLQKPFRPLGLTQRVREVLDAGRPSDWPR
jgi:CheY-like chemotaxis protein